MTMRSFLQTSKTGKVSHKFFHKAWSSDSTILNTVGGRSYANYFSKQHLSIISPENVGAGKLKVPNKSDFVLPARFLSSKRPDPFARRPTSKCDPYDQGGKPLTVNKTLSLMATVDPEWKLMMREDEDVDEPVSVDDGSHDDDFVPFAISRIYWHDEYLQGAKFSTHVAAVAQMNAQHFPHEVVLSRKLQSRTKTWKVCTQILCRTHVLQGLSHHDFYLATLIDIEAQRPEVRGLIADDQSTK